MDYPNTSNHAFFARLGTSLACGWRVLVDGVFAGQIAELLRSPKSPESRPPSPLPSERVHASGLLMLAMLQREGRLVDFLQEDVTAFADAEIGAAARIVHGGCRKVLEQCLTLEPVLPEEEGAPVTIPAGFDAQRIRLTGNVTGQPPFRGALKHHGWLAKSVKLPVTADTLDPRVLAPAEVELA